MAKNPYIKFYIGDYIKDTRILPLNVRGAWVDLILFMWDNREKGEITGTIEEFSRLMCCSIEEANLVIQTLKQRNIFSWEELPGGVLKIISRKQKNMQILSETRSNSGKNGGNPALVKPNKEILLNQIDKENCEYENESENENKIESKGAVLGEVIWDIEKYLLERQKDFEVSLMIKPGMTLIKGKEILKKYHLWNKSNEKYPKHPLALIAGFQSWILNEKNYTNGTAHRVTNSNSAPTPTVVTGTGSRNF